MNNNNKKSVVDRGVCQADTKTTIQNSNRKKVHQLRVKGGPVTTTTPKIYATMHIGFVSTEYVTHLAHILSINQINIFF